MAILGVALGSGLLVTLLSLSEGIESRFFKTFQRLSGTISVSSKRSGVLGRLLGDMGDPLPASYAEEIKELSGVGIVAPYVVTQIPSAAVSLPAFAGLGLTGIGEGGEELFDFPTQKIVEGRSFEKEEEVIAGKHMVTDSKFLKQEIKVGDKFKAPVGKTGKFVELTIVGVFKTDDPINDYGFIGQESLVRKIAQIPEDKISAILVRVEDPSEAENIAGEIEDLFKGRKREVYAMVPAEAFESLSSFLGVLNAFLLAIALVAAVAGGMAVMVVMLLTSFERRREFGVLKASGWSNKNIIFSVLITSLTFSLLGAAFGLGLGAGAVFSIRYLLPGQEEMVTFTWEIFAWAAGVGTLTGLIGGLLPSLQAARVSPIETLRSE